MAIWAMKHQRAFSAPLLMDKPAPLLLEDTCHRQAREWRERQRIKGWVDRLRKLGPRTVLSTDYETRLPRSGVGVVGPGIDHSAIVMAGLEHGGRAVMRDLPVLIYRIEKKPDAKPIEEIIHTVAKNRTGFSTFRCVHFEPKNFKILPEAKLPEICDKMIEPEL